MPFKRVNPKLPGERLTDYTKFTPLDEFPQATGPDLRPSIGGFTQPGYRLDQELRKRGFKPHEGYTIADYHYERKLKEPTTYRNGEKWITQDVTWTQQVWLVKKGEKWEPCWNANPATSSCAAPFDTLEQATDEILRWVDKYDREGHVRTEEAEAMRTKGEQNQPELERLDRELMARGFRREGTYEIPYQYFKRSELGNYKISSAFISEDRRSGKWTAFYRADGASSDPKGLERSQLDIPLKGENSAPQPVPAASK